MFSTKIFNWILSMAACCSNLIPTGFSSTEIWRSASMARTVCEQWAEFNKTGAITKPIKDDGNTKLCGWFSRGIQGDACADIRHHWLGCRQEINATSRIVGGAEARAQKFPSFLGIRHGEELQQKCGATILNEEWALTAAHCADDEVPLTMYAGDQKLGENETTEQIVVAKEYFIHPNFLNLSHHRDHYFDIALIKFAPKLNFTHAVQPVQLATEDFVDKNAIGVNIGQGRDENLDVYTLKEVELEVLTVDECIKLYQEIGKEINFTDILMCSRYPGRDFRNVCYGDSGSPLYVCENNKLVQIGITVFIAFVGKCNSNLPVGYTRLSKYIPWIKETMSKH